MRSRSIRSSVSRFLKGRPSGAAYLNPLAFVPLRRIHFSAIPLRVGEVPLRAYITASTQPPQLAQMSYQFLTLDVSDRIATLTVNRPDKLNALNDATISELGVAIDQIRVDDSIGGAILTGAGRAFVAGADISELSNQTPVLAKARARAAQDVFRRFE